MKSWLMRAGSGGIAKEFCLQHDVIAMDWEVGDLSGLPDDLKAFKAAYRSACPMDGKGQVDQNASTIHRFVHIMHIAHIPQVRLLKNWHYCHDPGITWADAQEILTRLRSYHATFCLAADQVVMIAFDAKRYCYVAATPVYPGI